MARQTPATFSVPTPTQTPERSPAVDAHPVLAGIGARAALVVAIATGLGVGTLLMLALAGPPPLRLQQDAGLASLVRSMVLIKGLILAFAASLVAWRLGRPVSSARLLGYVGTLGTSAAAVTWMWSLNAIPIAALFFYGGLIACFFNASRDAQLLSIPASRGARAS